jgi:putative ABC transport system permease protein
MDHTPIIADKRPLRIPWLFEMALRDSRRNRPRLFLFMSSIIFGIAALVAVSTFGFNLKKDADSQAATLIGADLSISSNKPFDADMRSVTDSLGNRRSQECSFLSMVYFPSGRETRLVQIRALQGQFPYYGSLETIPEQAGKGFRKGKMALVDQTLMFLFHAKVNDSIKVGQVTFLIAGALNKAPGQLGIASAFAPIVYIPMQYLAQTGLIQTGSPLSYTFYYKFDHQVDMDQMLKPVYPLIDQRNDRDHMSYDTIEKRKENIGRAFGNLSRFLSLVGFIALLLGCVGVASAINIYVREKIASIAIMRCLGVKGYEAFLIYLIQIAGIGLIGSLIGSLSGTLVQHFLPVVFKEFLPVSVSTEIYWPAIWQGVLLGLTISILFALLPLIAIRHISPLNTLRLAYEPAGSRRDPLRWLVYLLIFGFMVSFSRMQLGSWSAGVFFTIGILAAFLLLTLSARLLIYLVKLLVKSSWSYLWRQGFANLYRPNNQTLTLVVSIGLSTALICTLFFIQNLLVRQAEAASGSQANMALFNIQTGQEKNVADLALRHHLPLLQQVPVVSVRIQKINGKTVDELGKDAPGGLVWLYHNEFHVTYRDSLTPTEKIIEGKWIGHAPRTGEVPVSFEDGVAHGNGLKLGDYIVFNVHGTQIPAKITSLRAVSWNKLQTTFNILFPQGVLEDAPQMHILLTKTPSKSASAAFQQAVVRQFPNASIIDLGFVLTLLDDVLDKLDNIISFMAMFSMITGVVVLIASIHISKFQRIQESILLRTMGASKRQIFAIATIEYFFLGALSAATGILIAVAGSWSVAKFSLDISFDAHILPAILLFLAIALLTIIIGLFNSSGILNKPPLEILRKEV